MKKLSLFLILLSGACGQSWSHEAPVPINHIQWTVDAKVLQVHLHAGAPWWVLNVFEDQTPPPSNWPDRLKKEAKTYFDQHFILRADGKILPSQLVSYRYSEEVWRYYLGSQMDLEFSYTLPASVQTISGQATFYNEDAGGRHETYLHIDGAPAHSMTLTLDHPEFSFPLSEIVRSSTRRRFDAGLEGFMVWETMPWVVLAFAAFQLQLRTRAKKFVYYSGLIGMAIIGALLLSRGRHPGNLLFGVYQSFTAMMDPGLQSAGMTDRVGYGVGFLMSLLGIALAIEAGLGIYQRRLMRVSESQAHALFTSQIRFVSLLLGGMTLLLISHYFQKPT